jgi:hypothetical protein
MSLVSFAAFLAFCGALLTAVQGAPIRLVICGQFFQNGK